MDANSVVLLVLLIVGLTFNGRDVIRRGLARVPVPLRGRKVAR